MSEVLERLLRRRRFGIKPGLDPEEELLEALGRPERSFAAVHVAGTNGKGSVCAMLAAVLQAAGYRTGLYTSPHLVRLNERFRVDGADIGDDELDALAQRVDETARELEHRTGRPLTFFECSTAMAFEHFRRRGVQLAVIEVGMGGRLDATNVLTGALSVITRIDMDHTAYLGHDLGAIAREKAGIIKPARPVVAGAMPEEALEVVERVAREAGSPLVLAGEAARVEFVAPDGGGQRVRLSTVSGDYGVLRLPLRGRHQLENLATAAAAVETLRDRVGLVVRDEALVAGLAATRWVGRFYEARQDPPLVLDGAHNAGGMRVLLDALRQYYPGRPLGFVMGMCVDKDAVEVLRLAGAAGTRFWSVPIRNERDIGADTLRQLAAGHRVEMRALDLAGALDEARQWAKETGGVVCVTGSLFLVGEALERLS